MLPGPPSPHVAANPRALPASMADRLIVALDVDSVAAATALADRLAGTVSFFKLGLWLLLAPGAERLIDRLAGGGSRLFVDAKMYDIPQTVERGVAAVARRGASILTVHGDAAIIEAAVRGRGASALKVFAVTVLTSLDDAALAALGYGLTARALVARRAADAVRCGADGIIASADDDPDAIRRHAGSDRLLVATPGVRQAAAGTHDHKRTATPGQAIARGADYLVVGRPILAAPDPVAAARAIIAEMEAARPA